MEHSSHVVKKIAKKFKWARMDEETMLKINEGIDIGRISKSFVSKSEIPETSFNYYSGILYERFVRDVFSKSCDDGLIYEAPTKEANGMRSENVNGQFHFFKGKKQVAELDGLYVTQSNKFLLVETKIGKYDADKIKMEKKEAAFRKLYEEAPYLVVVKPAKEESEAGFHKILDLHGLILTNPIDRKLLLDRMYQDMLDYSNDRILSKMKDV